MPHSMAKKKKIIFKYKIALKKYLRTVWNNHFFLHYLLNKFKKAKSVVAKEMKGILIFLKWDGLWFAVAKSE